MFDDLIVKKRRLLKGKWKQEVKKDLDRSLKKDKIKDKKEN